MAAQKKRKITYAEALLFLTIGFELLAFSVSLGYAGYLLDDKYNSFPQLSLSGFALGFVIWCLHVYKVSKKYFK